MVAAAVGLGSTWFALTRGAAFGTLQIGAWTARPRTRTPGNAPHPRAARGGAGARRRAAGRAGRRRRLRGHDRRPATPARWPLRHRDQRDHAAGALLHA